jgi:hypothetical protein
MKTNRNNLAQDCGSKHKTYSSSSHKVCFCVFGFPLLGFCFLSANVSAKIPSEQLDPLNLLMFHSARLSQDVTAPVISMWVAKLQQTLPELSKTEAPVLWEASDSPAVNFGAQLDQNLPRSSFSSTADPNKRLVDPNQDKEPFADLSFPETTQDTAGSNLKRQLWQAQISAPIIEEDKETKDELQQIIEQIYAIEFKPRKGTPKAVAIIEPTAITEPNETPTVTAAPEQPKETQTTPGPSYEPVTEQTLQTLRNLLHHPEQLNNPFELGEVLFLSGHLKEASVAYKEALKRKSPDGPGPAQDRAWVLFQIGNCLRNDDLPSRAKIYSQLIREYPDSPWSDLAKAQYKLIDWYMKDKPRTLIAESQF